MLCGDCVSPAAKTFVAQRVDITAPGGVLFGARISASSEPTSPPPGVESARIVYSEGSISNGSAVVSQCRESYGTKAARSAEKKTEDDAVRPKSSHMDKNSEKTCGLAAPSKKYLQLSAHEYSEKTCGLAAPSKKYLQLSAHEYSEKTCGLAAPTDEDEANLVRSSAGMLEYETGSPYVGGENSSHCTTAVPDASINGIVWHDAPMRRSGVTRPGIEPGSPWWEASRLTAQPPSPRYKAAIRAGGPSRSRHNAVIPVTRLPSWIQSGGPVVWGRGLVLTAVNKQHGPWLILAGPLPYSSAAPVPMICYECGCTCAMKFTNEEKIGALLNTVSVAEMPSKPSKCTVKGVLIGLPSHGKRYYELAHASCNKLIGIPHRECNDKLLRARRINTMCWHVSTQTPTYCKAARTLANVLAVHARRACSILDCRHTTHACSSVDDRDGCNCAISPHQLGRIIPETCFAIFEALKTEFLKHQRPWEVNVWCGIVGDCFIGPCFIGDCFIGPYFIGDCFIGPYFIGDCFIGPYFIGDCFIGPYFIGDCFIGPYFIGDCFIGPYFIYFIGDCFIGPYFIGDCFIGPYFIGDCFVGPYFIGDCFIGPCFIGDCFIGPYFIGDCFIGPYFIERTITGPTYTPFLQRDPTGTYDIPLGIRLGMWFQHDGGPVHFLRWRGKLALALPVFPPLWCSSLSNISFRAPCPIGSNPSKMSHGACRLLTADRLRSGCPAKYENIAKAGQSLKESSSESSWTEIAQIFKSQVSIGGLALVSFPEQLSSHCPDSFTSFSNTWSTNTHCRCSVASPRSFNQNCPRFRNSDTDQNMFLQITTHTHIHTPLLFSYIHWLLVSFPHLTEPLRIP
ncbi:hypothetical protein PR048_020590 [Dryococelus australis]|uniref:Uncharacterized protein n=1 Tax=Dryococelus australis TaxID=614101 RepID=A0ABQ9H6Q4_9NEOP|nr:hypothetical protein PR048_020590 [Dryococelus australis]